MGKYVTTKAKRNSQKKLLAARSNTAVLRCENIRFNNARQDDVKNEKIIFQKMFSAHGLKIAKPYLDEEAYDLQDDILKENLNSIRNIVVIGAGPLRYLEAASGRHYIAIDKFQSAFLSNRMRSMMKNVSIVTLINKPFESISIDDLPLSHNLYIFTFNVISYINNPVALINKIAQTNSLIYISGWNEMNSDVMHQYLDYLYGNVSFCIRDASSFLDVHAIDFSDCKKIQTINKRSGLFTKSILMRTY